MCFGSRIRYLIDFVMSMSKSFSGGLYLATDATLDADGDGTADVDAETTAANLEHAITTWSAGHVSVNRPFTLYMVDHGEYDQFYLNVGETVAPTALHTWLSQLEQQQPGTPVQVIVESCFSGSFIDLAETLSQVGRIIITSTDAHNLAYAPTTQDGAIFSNAFTDALAQGEDIFRSFLLAHQATITAHRDQTPWIDVNGNSIPNEPADYLPGASIADVPDEEQWPPFITDVKLVGEIQQGRGQVQASVLDDAGVQLVWAEIYPPSYTPPVVSAELARSGVPSVILEGQANDQYQGAYAQFDEVGTYRLVLHAIDNAGLQAQPVELLIPVEQAGGRRVYLPLVSSQ
jgi:hypothetical protein